jgi:hypothetical protein
MGPIDRRTFTKMAAAPVGLELPVLALSPGLSNIARRPASDLR